MKFKTETELAEIVVRYLRDMDYEVFQEVELFQGGQRVDIVARHGRILWAIETKLSLSLAVLDQAWRDRQWFHYSSVAVPSSRESAGRELAVRVGHMIGVGILSVNGPSELHESAPAVMNRKAMTQYVHLHEEQKNWAAAGNSQGLRWSPFQSTKRELIQYVQQHEGCRLKDAMGIIKHHYNSHSTATGSMRKWINDGVIKELRIEHGKVFIRK
jgi:hypothetical protein